MLYIICVTFIFSYAAYRHSCTGRLISQSRRLPPTESDINIITASSVVYATFILAANNPTYCYYECILSETIKCEPKLPDDLQEDGAGNQHDHGVDGRILLGLQSVKCEEQLQELHEQQAFHSSINTDQASTWTCDVNEVKVENKASRGEHGRNSDEVKQWVVCPGRVLKQVKAEHTLGVSDISPVEDIDPKAHISSTNHSKMKCGSQLEVHERTGTGVKHLTVDTCGQSVAVYNTLVMHERTHTGVKPYTCDTCGQSFAFSSKLMRHERTHTGVKPYICDTCGQSFACSGTLARHVRTHTGVKPYTCDACGLSFSHSGTLKQHERTHTGVKPYTCDTCGQSFAQSGALKRHERTHTGVKPYTCDTCGKSFAQSGALNQHERIHTGVKPYTCGTCGQSFARFGTLTQHERTHTGVKHYPCDTCGQSFALSGALARHMRIQTGVKHYTCDICGKSFAQSGTITRHVRTHRCETLQL